SARADLIQIHYRGELPLAPQISDRARHHARLARRTGAQHVAESLLVDAPHQLAVGSALDVAGTVRLDGPAYDEKISGLDYLSHNGKDCRCGEEPSAIAVPGAMTAEPPIFEVLKRDVLGTVSLVHDGADRCVRRDTGSASPWA